MTTPVISVVVPGLNAASTLDRCLGSIREQMGTDCELLFVDNGSTDGSRQIAARWTDAVLEEPRRGAGSARNRGARAARGRLLLFCDSDCVPDRGWLEAYRGVRFDARTLYGGPIRAVKMQGVVERYVETLYDQQASIEKFSIPAIISANFGLCRDFFFELEGFDSRLRLGEDVDLSYRAFYRFGAKFRFVREAVVTHENANDLWALFLKARQHGTAAGWVLEKFGPELGRTPAERALREISAFQALYALVQKELGTGQTIRSIWHEPSAEVLDAVVRVGKELGLLESLLSLRRRRLQRGPWRQFVD